MQGNFGVSLRLARPVSTLIVERLPATLELVVTAALLALFVGIPLGVYTALRRHSLAVAVLLTFSLVGVSLPTFLIGILLILIFSVWLGLAAVVRARRDGEARLVDHGPPHPESGLKALILPVHHALPVPDDADHAAGARRDARGAAHRLHQVRARPRPHQPRRAFRPRAQEHAGAGDHDHRACSSARIIAFAIITETVFQWPGMGLLFIQSVQFADIPVMAAYLCLIALIFVVINLVVDLLYYAVDPRLRIERPAAAGH